MSEFFNDTAKVLSGKGTAASTHRADRIDPRGTTWDELKRKLFTPEEIAASERRAKKMINRTRRRQARRRKKMLR